MLLVFFEPSPLSYALRIRNECAQNAMRSECNDLDLVLYKVIYDDIIGDAGLSIDGYSVHVYATKTLDAT